MHDYIPEVFCSDGHGDDEVRIIARVDPNNVLDLREAVADARLIAAAPDLLAACESALRYIGDDPPADEAPREAWGAWSQLEHVLLAAIAKAQGTEVCRGL